MIVTEWLCLCSMMIMYVCVFGAIDDVQKYTN